MLLRNDLLTYVEPEKLTLRVLWLSPAQPSVVVIDVNASDALPKLMQLEVLLEDLRSGRANLLVPDPYLPIVNEDALTDARKSRRDRAWKLIADLVRDEPRIYDPKHRTSMINACVHSGLATLPTLWLYLRRYWQRGQTPNALLADYDKSGGKGKKRESLTGIKRGRPRQYGDELGLNVTEDIRKIFHVAVTRYYVTNKKFSLRGAYDQMLTDFFSDRSSDAETGRVTHVSNKNSLISERPSFPQFYYWFGQDSNRLHIKRQRIRPRIYDKDLRGLLGTSNAEVWGPGARYQIDATIADVYLVSRVDRKKIIGRPVLYIVIDVFSRMIVGIYVGLEGPSWVGAMMALANTAADKVAFCKRFGLEIAPEEWPCRHLPAILLGDRGEIEGRMIESLINNFNVTVENAAAYRADWKGIVEQRFRLLPAKFKPYVPGYIEPDFRARGAHDYRLDAVLDIDQFTEIIIECVLYYNNYHEIKSYDRDRDLASDNVLAVPIDLWEWGIANRSGSLRTFPEEQVRFSLLPSEEATVTLNGIRLQGVFYTCQKALEERWFDRARQYGTWKVKVSYDPRNLDEIYLHDEQASRQFQICSMTERSRAFRNVSLWELGQSQVSEKNHSANHQPKQQRAVADLISSIESVVADASQLTGGDSKQSAASRTKHIRANRAEEKQANRKAEAFRFATEKSTQPRSADILPFPDPQIANYSEPDITEILGTPEGDDE